MKPPTKAMDAAGFAAALRFTVPAEIKERSRRVYLDAVTQLHASIAGDTPVKTGFLRAGLLATPMGVQPTPLIAERAPDAKEHQYDPEVDRAAAQAATGIAAAVRGFLPITIGFVASYAPYVEDHRHMVKRARARWRKFVERAIANAGGSKSGGGGE